MYLCISLSLCISVSIYLCASVYVYLCVSLCPLSLSFCSCRPYPRQYIFLNSILFLLVYLSFIVPCGYSSSCLRRYFLSTERLHMVLRIFICCLCNPSQPFTKENGLIG